LAGFVRARIARPDHTVLDLLAFGLERDHLQVPLARLVLRALAHAG
jgi:hypothetical protein